MLNLFDPKKQHTVCTHLQTAKAKLQLSADSDIGVTTSSTSSTSDIKSVKSSTSTLANDQASPSRSVQRHTSSSTNRRRSLPTNGAAQKDQQVCIVILC
jgi:hypothetical protein